MQIVMCHSVTTLFRQQVVIDERLRGLRCKLHHHACRGVGIHIGILAGDIIILDVHDVEEHVARLGLTSHRTLMAVGDVALSHVLAARLHQLHLNGILNLLDGHLTLAFLGDMIGNLVQQALVFSLVGMEHGLADGSHNLLLVEANDASVAFYNCLNHIF